MKKLLIVVVVIVGCAAALGFHRGWFRLGSDSDAGKRSVTVTMDKDKIEQDKETAVQKVQNGARQAKKSAATTTDAR